MPDKIAQAAVREAQAAGRLPQKRGPVDELLSPKQVHAEYGFSPQTLANWRWMDMGPDYIKQTPGRGGRIKYKRSRIEAWLDAQTVTIGGAAA